MRVRCQCRCSVFKVHPLKQETLGLVCSGCGKSYRVKIDSSGVRAECARCRSQLFVVHTPPRSAATRDKIVYVMCTGCQALQEVGYGELGEADSTGVLKGEG
jgi:DNA-directed RNA polymerase subunit RPC12/RpoP